MAASRALDGEIVSRRGGLGRGLDALLPPSSSEGMESKSKPVTARIERITPNPNQPRETFESGALEELTRSIAELGVLQPLLVREVSGAFQLIAGERRLRAATAAGLQEVPIVVVETDERGSLERALVENIHRSDLNPIEEAAAYRQLLEAGSLTQEALASKLGRGRVTISNALRLLDLPVDVQSLLTTGRLSAGHGRALLGLQGNPLQLRLARRASDESLSVREVEEMVRRYQSMSSTGPRRVGGADHPAATSDAQRRLSDHLQTRVRVEMGKRKGKIVLDFVSPEELERIVGIITGAKPGAMTTKASPDAYSA